MIALDALARLCPPPADPPPAVDWAQAERAVGAALPADYKQLVETYGDGIFDDTIWLLVPDSAYSDCDLHVQMTERDEILADLWEVGQEKPAGLLEAGARVLPWAFEEGTGAFLYWLARPGQQPDAWTARLAAALTATGPAVPAPEPAPGPQGPAPAEALTGREVDVLRLIAGGSTNREIASRLFLSEGTVKNHISRILGRLNLRDRTQAALCARDHGLL
ncbi:LuxR C-terminal-related transcriptional regulator [Streptomyces diastatochromogenes]|uniref:helix-turn-helix transcriptional regulator n=1 Tax=Streptomyces diastatochromogenes TaxID=42236 RepID=UPI003668ABD9